jgi:3-hydroxyacyl-CoA dehydrogenase
MHIDQALECCAVLGAAGKPGRDIAFLLLREIAFHEAISYGCTGTGKYRLILIDGNAEALVSLETYLHSQLNTFALAHINDLRNVYAADAHLISNDVLLQNFIQGAKNSIIFSSELSAATSAYLVFDCLPEDGPLKSKALKALHLHSQQPQYYMENTSCIPIYLLNEQAELGGTIIGFHFCDPPLEQKLIEVIPLNEKNTTLNMLARAICARLNRHPIYALDFPGFISNGYLMRELAFAIHIVEGLAPLWGYAGAIYAVEWLTKFLLVRERGIFQQIDYIGIERCHQTASAMSSLLNDSDLHMPLLSMMKTSHQLGGQDDQSHPLPGFFQYNNGTPSAIYDIKSGKYVPWNDSSLDSARKELSIPSLHLTSWKELSLMPTQERVDILHMHFQQLTKQICMGHEMALYYLNNCRLIVNALLATEAASSPEDIHTILTENFGHLYSPLETWLPFD